MTKTTTETSKSALIFSWLVALVGFVGLALLLWLMPTPENEIAKLPDNEARSVRKLEKKEKSERPLPPKYSSQLIEQSEVLVKKNLQKRLSLFKEMSAKMRQRKETLLTQVETRDLPSSAPSDANETSMARNIPVPVGPPLAEGASVKELYERLMQYEKEIHKNNLAVNAAERSLKEGLSFPEVYNKMSMGSSFMTDFEELIRNQSNGQEWKRNKQSTASAGLEIDNTGELNRYRRLLGQAARESGLAEARLESLFGIPRPVENKPPGRSNTTGGEGEGNGGMAVNFDNTSSKTPMNPYQGTRLNQDIVKAQALPGRRFSKSADRKGWLYINTWYIIGPWENYGRDDFAISHPPEVSVDLDAVYTDGQIGTGIAETDSDPLKMVGDTVQLNGDLRWKFMQSESMHNTVPVTTSHSTYYAYTELYFDEATKMLVAIGTDDSGRLWINGEDVWKDKGTSWYHIDEHISAFDFRQGWNRVLIRLENAGGGPTGFSFLIIPGEAIDESVIDDES